MPKHEYQRKDFQPIPTPEEEALDELRTQGSKNSGRAVLAFGLCLVSALFHNEIIDGINAIVRLLT